jgi:predicted ABC-type ATPase
MAVPELWLLAGPNGAGKTTTTQRQPIAGLLPNVTFLNPDDRTLAKLRAAGYRGFGDAPADVQTTFIIQSANEVLAAIHSAIARGEPIGVETVLSSGKYRALVNEVLASRGYVWLLYVALSSPEIAAARVAARVRRGGLKTTCRRGSLARIRRPRSRCTMPADASSRPSPENATP